MTATADGCPRRTRPAQVERGSAEPEDVALFDQQPRFENPIAMRPDEANEGAQGARRIG